MAGARAHNRWLAELCRHQPGAPRGVAIVPIFDVDAAVAEIRRARESGLRGGILIPSMWQPYPPYHDPVYDPVWATCAELGMPVHVHSGSADKASYGPHVGMYTTEVRWWSSRPLWFLIWAGVFDRHPGLRFVVTECGAFWAPDLLWTMDTVYDREHGSRKLGEQLTANLSRRPSEVFDAQCAIGASNTRRRELARRYEIGVANIMWGNDFPHPEGTWPHTREWLQGAFHDIPVDRDPRDARRQRGGDVRLRRRRRSRRWPPASAPRRPTWARPAPTWPSGTTWRQPGGPGSPASRRCPRWWPSERRCAGGVRPVRGRLRRLALRAVRPPAGAGPGALVRAARGLGAHPARRRGGGAARPRR